MSLIRKKIKRHVRYRRSIVSRIDRRRGQIVILVLVARAKRLHHLTSPRRDFETLSTPAAGSLRLVAEISASSYFVVSYATSVHLERRSRDARLAR